MNTTEQLIELLSAQKPPAKRAMHPLVLWAIWVTGAFAYIALLSSFGVRIDLMQQLRVPVFLAEVLSLAAIIMFTGLAAAFLAYPDMRQRPQLVWLPLLPLLIFIAVVVNEYMVMSPEASLPPTAMECTICILLYATVPAAWLIVLLRRHATTRPAVAGALVVAAATSIGALALRLHEQTDSIPHLLTWHYLPMVLFSMVGMQLGRIFFKW